MTRHRRHRRWSSSSRSPILVRDGQVANRPFYVAIGVTMAGGTRDSRAVWAGSGGEGGKFWMAVLTDLKNRGVTDTFFVVCDGLKGLPEVVTNVWPQAIVQTCVIHLIRNPFRLTSRKYWDELKRDLKRGLYRGQCHHSPGCVGRPGPEVGRPLPGRDPALEQRLGRIYPVPGLRRRDQDGDLLHQRHRGR